MSPKYPRTPHLPFSPGGTSDDRRIQSVSSLLGCPVVITEKMDGSNVCLERDACFARSHASTPNHPSFDAFKALHAGIQHNIGVGVQVFGEWLYAKHSIAYSALPSYLMVFGVRDLSTGLWASWEEVGMWADCLGVACAPVLALTSFTREDQLQGTVEGLAREPSKVGGDREGIVIRKAGEIPDGDFATSVAKWVRKDHVQSDDHWKNQAIVRNMLG